MNTYLDIIEDLWNNAGEERIKEVLLQPLDDSVAASTRKMLCRLAKSNVDNIASDLEKLSHQSIRTLIKQIVTESWEHMLSLYSNLVEKQCELCRFFFECELFNYVKEISTCLIENYGNDDKKTFKENTRKLKKAAKFIAVLSFKNPTNSILLNSLRIYLEQCIVNKNYLLVFVLRSYLMKRKDFDCSVLKNFRNGILRHGEQDIRTKFELIDLYNELVDDFKDNCSGFTNIYQDMKKYILKTENFGKFTSYEIKSLKFDENVLFHRKT